MGSPRFCIIRIDDDIEATPLDDYDDLTLEQAQDALPKVYNKFVHDSADHLLAEFANAHLTYEDDLEVDFHLNCRFTIGEWEIDANEDEDDTLWECDPVTGGRLGTF